MTAPFDVGHRRLTGTGVPVLDPASVCGGCNGDAKVRISAGGSAVYMTGNIAARLECVASDGKETAAIDEVRSFVNPRVSPDGKHIAVGIVGAQSTDIWTYDIASATLSRVTQGGNSSAGEWTEADSRRSCSRASSWSPRDSSRRTDTRCYT